MNPAALFRRIQRFVLLAAAASLSAAIPCAAQMSGAQQQENKNIPLSKVERKNKAPVSKEILRVNLPKPVETSLPNGLSVLILEDHRLPTVSAQIQISGAGGIYEPADQRGLASFTADMLREGTKTRNSQQMAEALDRMGATLSAFAPFASSATSLQVSGLSDNFDDWFPLMADVLLNPTFPADELAKFKLRQLAAMRQQRSQPGFLASEQFNKVLFGSFPAAVIAASPQFIQGVTSDALAKWHDTRYAPQNSILAIAGDVHATDLIPKLTRWFADWKKTDAQTALPANPKPSTTRKVILVDRPDSVQTVLQMGNISIDRRDPDYVPIVVLNQVLGSGPQSRLFMNLREEKGYTYGVYSGFTALKYAGPWQASGSLRTEVTGPAMDEFLKEITRLQNEKVADAELDAARRSIVASFALSLEQPTSLLNYAVIRKIYDFPADYWDSYPSKIMAVTPEDVQRVARKYYNPDAMLIVAVGDGSKIRTVMEKFGPLEAYNADGKPLAPAAAAPPPGKQ